MFTMHPYFNLHGVDGRMQLQTMDRVQDQPHFFGPYLKYPTGRYSTLDTLDTGSCAYRIQQQQAHQKLVSTKPEVRDHIQAPSNTLFQGMQFPMTEYTYPTLNFMFNGADLLHTANDNGILLEEYEQRTSSGKQTHTEKLHPFYKRQCLAPSRDGLTRTRDKYRVVYTEKQKNLLEDEYDQTRFLHDARREGLAKETELSERQIKFWFQNRRAKDKRNRKTLKRDNISSRPTSDKHTLTKDIQKVKSDCKIIKEMEEIITSCKFTSQRCSSEHIAIPINDGQVEKQLQPSTHIDKVSPRFTSSCKYLKLQPSIPTTNGTCRFESKLGYSEEGTSSPLGSQYFCQYPVSPSEWAMANQRPYLSNNTAFSPLVNGLHYGFDYRL